MPLETLTAQIDEVFFLIGAAILLIEIAEIIFRDEFCQCRSKIPQKCRSNFPHFRDLVTSQIRGLS
jgi:hypothetical protein